jgi:hypothetical protein
LFLKSMFKYRIGELTRPQNVTLVKWNGDLVVWNSILLNFCKLVKLLLNWNPEKTSIERFCNAGRRGISMSGYPQCWKLLSCMLRYFTLIRPARASVSKELFCSPHPLRSRTQRFLNCPNAWIFIDCRLLFRKYMAFTVNASWREILLNKSRDTTRNSFQDKSMARSRDTAGISLGSLFSPRPLQFHNKPTFLHSSM